MEDAWEVVCIGEMILDMFAAETGRGYDGIPTRCRGRSR
jgi:hypothetical protein